MEESVQIVNRHGVPVAIGPDGEVVRAPDPVLEAARRNWNDLSYLYECYENFLKAVQMAASKDYQYKDTLDWVAAGAPRWNQSDTFMAWVIDQQAMVEYRLKELKQRFEQKTPSDKNLIKLIDSGSIDDPHPYLGKEINIEEQEILEWLLRKSLEALIKFRSGQYEYSEVVRHAP